MYNLEHQGYPKMFIDKVDEEMRGKCKLTTGLS